MGPDMYLYRKSFVRPYENPRPDQLQHEVLVKCNGEIREDIRPDKIQEIVELVMSWRGANQIHAWFIRHNDGIDDWPPFWISLDQLIELRDLCREALLEQNPELLPPQEGFVFGSAEVDSDYWEDIKTTEAELTKIIDIEEKSSRPLDVHFEYEASW